MKKWDLLLAHIANNIPKFKIIEKESSRLMRLLSFLLFFNKRFMKDFTTTIYPVIYYPKQLLQSGDEIGRIIILCHEYVHLQDRKKLGILFNILYLSPQIFVLLALLSIWFSNNWLWCLLFILPMPSPFRAYFEYKAYKMSMCVYYYILNKTPPIDFYVEQFTSPNYYWMFPFKGFMYKNFAEHVKNIRNKKIDDELIIEIKNILLPLKNNEK
jgi:hypothetical protein